MLSIHAEAPTVVARHDGPLDAGEATHHYCTVGRAAGGAILAFWSMHPDVAIPASLWRQTPTAGSDCTVPKFRPRDQDPAYRWPYLGACARSTDGGRTWSAPQPTDGWGGTAIAVGTETLSPYCHLHLTEPGSAVGAFRVSADGGLTWGDRPEVRYTWPREFCPLVDECSQAAGPARVMSLAHGAALKVLADGSAAALATAQVSRAGRRWWLPVMFRSRDECHSFEFVGLPAGDAPPADHEGFTEPALAELADGDLLAVMRTEYHRPDRVLVQCRSRDGGRSWSDPVASPGVPRHYPLRRLHPIRNAGKTHLNAANVSPWLATLADGVVALAYGRPGVYIAFSEEGTGRVWRDRIPLVPEPSLLFADCDSSHMAAVIDSGPHELVAIYDVYNHVPPAGGRPGNTVFALRLTVGRQ